MSNKYHNIVIALSGVCQGAVLVSELANTGQCDHHLYDVSMGSIFNTSPKTTEDVFGNINNISLGLQNLIEILSVNQRNNVDVMRYMFGSLGIAHRLTKKAESLNSISQRLARIQLIYPINENSFQEHCDEISYALAGIYCDFLSPLTSKIKVIGKPNYLQNELVQAKVRTALFGSVRAAILWSQVGGNRWQFVLDRKKMINIAKNLWNQVNHA